MFYSKIFSHCPPPHTPKQDYSNKEMYENQDSSAQHYYSFYFPNELENENLLVGGYGHTVLFAYVLVLRQFHYCE